MTKYFRKGLQPPGRAEDSAHSANRLTRLFCACALASLCSGCGALPILTGLTFSPGSSSTGGRSALPPATGTGGGRAYTPNSADCVRDWARPECQHGNVAAPTDGTPQPAPEATETSKQSGDIGTFLTVLLFATALAGLISMLAFKASFP